MNFQYIDGQTPLTVEEAAGLKVIAMTHEELNAFEQENIIAARLWASSQKTLKKLVPFGVKELKEVHSKMYGSGRENYVILIKT